MGNNYGFNPSWMKKDDVARKNYVEITPEEQAAIDKANAEAKAALEKEALAQGLNGNKVKDLNKGISIQHNGLNLPTQEQIIANQGEIKPAAPWYERAWNNTAYHVWNFVKGFGEAVLGGAALTLGAAAAMAPVSCSEGPIDDVGVALTVTPEQLAKSTIDALNDPKNYPDGHSTEDGTKYTYAYDDQKHKPYVEFENGFKHYLNDDLSWNPNGTTSAMYDIMDKVSLVQLADVKEVGNITTDIEANEGSYGNGAEGFAMSFVTPADLQDITSGSPVVRGNIGEYNFQGKVEKVAAGKYTLEANGQTKTNAADGIRIVNENGDEIYMQYEENFDLQSVWDRPGQNEESGMIVYVKEKGADVFKERYILSKFDDTRTNIGLIDRSENGTTLQHYPSNINEFNANGSEDEYNRIYNAFEADANAKVNTDSK